MGPVRFKPGSVQENRTDSGEPNRFKREYIRAVREEIPHFPIVFLSLLFLTNKSSLLSLSSPMGDGAAAQRPAVVGGGAAVVNTLFFYFFFLSLLLPLLKPFLTSKTPNTNPILLDLQKNKNKRKRYHLYVLFGSV